MERKYHIINTIALTGIILLGAILYTLTIRGEFGNPVPSDFTGNLELPTGAFELSPERGRFTHVMSLANNNTYTLNEELRDIAKPDVGVHNGEFYSFFAPGIAYMAYPFYELGVPFNLGQITTFAFIAIMSIISMVFLFKIAREILRLPLWVSLMSVITFAFASTAWSYAITLYQHHVTTFFILSSFYAVWRFGRSGKFGFLWALFVWINYALAIAIDYPNTLLMLPVMIYFLVTTISTHSNANDESISVTIRLSAVVSIVAFIGITGLHLYHNNYYFQSSTQISSTLPGYSDIVLADRLTGESPSTLAEQANEKTVKSFFSEENVLKGFYTLTVSDDRGLFFYTPLFLLSLLGMYFMFRRGISLEEGFLLGIVGVNLLLYSSWGDPWGGWAYGTRYLIPSMGIFSLLTWYWVSVFAKPLIAKFVAIILFTYSTAIALLGVLTTNAVPPKSEGLFYDIKYNFNHNIEFLLTGESGSFFYNEFLSHSISLTTYFYAILAFLVIIALFIVFLLPRIEYDYNN